MAEPRRFDVIVIGAGAAGMMCAMTAGARGRRRLRGRRSGDEGHDCRPVKPRGRPHHAPAWGVVCETGRDCFGYTLAPPLAGERHTAAAAVSMPVQLVMSSL